MREMVAGETVARVAAGEGADMWAACLVEAKEGGSSRPHASGVLASLQHDHEHDLLAEAPASAAQTLMPLRLPPVGGPRRQLPAATALHASIGLGVLRKERLRLPPLAKSSISG